MRDGLSPDICCTDRRTHTAVHHHKETHTDTHILTHGEGEKEVDIIGHHRNRGIRLRETITERRGQEKN